MKIRICLIIGLYLIMTGLLMAANSAVFIMYHRFGENRYPQTNIRMTQFKQQLHLLKQEHYHVLPVPEIIQRLQQQQALPNKTVGIVIDDAYRSIYTKAWPLLRRYHFPFTIFVATDAVDQQQNHVMSWAQLRELAKHGVTIGNHTATHSHLTNMPLNKAIKDIQKAQQQIIKHTGITPVLFAYPYGEYNFALQHAIKKLGFEAAFMQVSGAAGFNSDFFALPRFAINEHYGELSRFRTITSALYMDILQVNPKDPERYNNPPSIRFKVLDQSITLKRLKCYASNQSRAIVYLVEGNHVQVQASHRFGHGRARINCTAPAGNGRFFWQGFYFNY